MSAIRPAAAVELDAGEAARLAERAFPALAPAQAVPLGSGWDNAAFLVNDAWVLRFPRRPEAVPLLEAELRVLPRLAPLLPTATSAPTLAARDVGGFPYPFAGYPRIEGTTACAIPAPSARAALAEPLARTLSALHGAQPVIEGPPPGDVLRKADVAHRLAWLREQVEGGPGAGAVLARAEQLVASAGAARAEPRWVHGDLYPRHLVVRGGALAGIIDWGDVHVGDPAIDLSVVFGWLPPAAQERFFAIYGAVDAATRARARFRALTYGAVFARHAAESGDEGFRAMGEIYLAQLVAASV